MSAVALSLLLAVSVQAPSVFLFGNPGGEWITISSDGVVLKRFRELHGIVPDDVAISADGKRWAMVKREVDKSPQLHLFEDDGIPPRTIVGLGNVMDGLSFSPDGEWLYLSANDSQSKLSHGETMAYAQVYRVNFLKPTLERVSSSRGCHMWPRAAGRNRVVFAHANCAGGRGLATLSVQGGLEKTLIPTTQHVIELAVRPDARAVFYVAETLSGTEFRLWDLSLGASELWLRRPVPGTRIRPQWTADGARVLFQEHDRVSGLERDGNVLLMAKFGEAR